MTFDKYCDLMKNHGVKELVFIYRIEKYYIEEYFNHSGTGEIRFSISCYGEDKYDNFEEFYDSFEDMINSKVFNGKSLKEIWKTIRIDSIDGYKEEEYLSKEHIELFDFATAQKQFGKLLYSYELSKRQMILYMLKLTIPVCLILILASTLMAIFKVSNWNIVSFFTISSFIAIIIVILKALKMKSTKYIITDNRIIISGWYNDETTYDRIKDIKVKKNKIKLIVKNGISLNWVLYVPDINKVEQIIKDNIK